MNTKYLVTLLTALVGMWSGLAGLSLQTALAGDLNDLIFESGFEGESVLMAVPGDQLVILGDSLSLQLFAWSSRPESIIEFDKVIGPEDLDVAANGLVTWTPGAGDLGINNVVVRAMDQFDSSSSRSFRVEVVTTPGDGGLSNLAPAIDPIADQAIEVGEPFSLQVVASDPEFEALTYELVSAPGGMTIDPAGLITFTPGPEQAGLFSVAVRVRDPFDLAATASFKLTVSPVNTAPTAVDDGYELLESESLVVDAPGILINDSDPENDPLSVSLLSGPSFGSLDLDPDGSFSYTPDTGTSPLGFDLKFSVSSPYGGPNSTPRIADVDGDGVTDIVVRYSNGVAGRNRMLVVRGDTGAVVYNSPPYDRSVYVGIGTDILADIDLDGRLEMISIGAEGGRSVGQSGQKLVAMEHDGTFKWVSDPIPSVGIFEDDVVAQLSFGGGEIAVADLDQDGTPEIIAGIAQGGAGEGIGMAVWDNQGKLLFTSYARGDIGGIGSQSANAYPEIVDLDLDGDLEVLILSAAFSHTGEVVWVRDDLDNNQMRATPIAANLDDDPYPELVRAKGGYETMALNHDGSTLWLVDTPFAFETLGVPLVVADVDDDGHAEVLGANNSFGPGRFVVLNGIDGSLKWQYPPEEDPGLNFHFVPPTVLDIDRDGETEVLLFTNDRNIYLLKGSDGSLIDTYDLGISQASQISFPMFADIDQDGASELVLSGTGAFTVGASKLAWVYEAPNDDWIPTGSIWNQQNFHVTNINPDGTVPQFERPHWLVPGLNQNRINALLPEERFTSFDSFEYQVSDGELTDDATVYLTVLPGGYPQILSTPDTTATVDFQYAYAPIVTDPDPGETFTFALTAAPPGMTIDPGTGLIRWIPATTGSFKLGWSVTDSAGLAAVQTYTLIVGEPVTVPDVVGQTEVAAQVTLAADNLVVGRITDIFDLEFAAGEVAFQNPPAGATAEFGAAIDLLVSLGPAPEDIDDDADTFTDREGDCDDGDNTVYPGALDTLGDGIDQNCDGVDGELALESIVVEPASSVLLSGKRIGFTADGIRADGTVINLTGLGAWSSDDTGVVNFTPDGFARTLAPGLTTISVEYLGIFGTAEVTVVGGVSGDMEPPVAQIDSPADAMEVSAPVDVVGTASDPNLLRWDLSISRGADEERTLIATGTTPVTDGVLAEFDPTLLMNGLYVLILEVHDRGGNLTEARSTVEVDGGFKMGNFSLSQQDLNVPLPGLPVSVVRTYDSRDKERGDFGFGWKLVLNNASVSTTRTLGTGWDVVGGGRSYALSPNDDHMVSVTLPDGSIHTFRMLVTPGSSFLLPFTFLKASFVPVGDAEGTLTTLDNLFLIIVDPQPGPVQLLDDSSFDVFNPQRFRYLSKGGTEFVIHRSLGLESIKDANGNALTFSESGIAHSSGVQVTFERDLLGRVTRIVDPMGHDQHYSYDGQGNLASHTDAEDNVTTFRYGRNHALLEILDPLGNRAVRSDYDDDGRLIAVTDAAGNRVEFTHDIEGREQLVRDPDGNIQRLLMDDEGNVLVRENTVEIEDIPTLATETFEYDERGNQVVSVDPDGVRTEVTFDENDDPVQTVVDPDGLAITTSATYNVYGQVLTETNALGQVTTYVYDDDGNLLSLTDALGQVTQYTYNDSGKILTMVDPLGTTTTRQYAAGGGLVSEEVTDSTGSLVRRTTFTVDDNNNTTSQSVYRLVDGVLTPFTTQFEYDASNRLIRTTDPLGNVSSREYDGFGNLVAEVDGRGNRTEYGYDVNGREISVLYADGSETFTAYDSRGNVVSKTDELGRTTTYEYDALNRKVATDYPDGAREETVYTPGGREVASIDALGNRTDFEYDSAGRQIRTMLPEVTDARSGTPLRPTLETVLDAAGRVTSQIDANGNATSFTRDLLGRPVTTTYADGTQTSTGFDALGRIVSQTDELGLTTTFTHDALSNLLTVTEPEPQPAAGAKVTTYRWNLTGNQISQTDALGRVTRYEYDALGRETRRILPGGQVATTEYDAAGNIAAQTDFNAAEVQYTYDQRNRLIRSTFPDASFEEVSYLDNGLRDVVVGRDETTTTTYDSRDRVLTVSQAGGQTITYTYDLNGQQTSMTTDNQSVIYSYDALGRLATVTDANGTTSYGYDPNGNKVMIERPNGSSSQMTFDQRNRTTRIEHFDAGDVLVEQFDYTYLDNGKRSSLAQADGSTETWVYDDLGRVIGAERTGTDPYSIVYTYDLVGNRLFIDRDGVVEAYTYDANDRILNKGPTTYSYDGNGNRTAKIEGGVLTQYEWDSKGQLTRVDDGGANRWLFSYDANGNRIEADRPTGIERYLVDELSPTGYAQVIEESDGSGLLNARNTYGADLIVSDRSAPEYPLVDGLGSTRVVLDETASPTAALTYTPFGETHGESGSAETPYRFAGEQLDADLDLYFLRARYYDPELGVFLGRDPFQGALEVPTTQHPYLYAAGDPINSIDPSGEFDLVSLQMAIQTIATQIAIRAPQACSAIASAKTAEAAAGVVIMGVNIATAALFAGSGPFSAGYNLNIPVAKSFRPLEKVSIGFTSTAAKSTISLSFGYAKEARSGVGSGTAFTATFDSRGRLVSTGGSLSGSRTITLVDISFCGLDAGEVYAGATATIGGTSTGERSGSLTGYFGAAVPAAGESTAFALDAKITLFQLTRSNGKGQFVLLGFPF